MSRIIIVSIEIENRRPYPVTKRLPRGSLVEVADPHHVHSMRWLRGTTR